MRIQDYLRVLRQRGWIIALLAVVAAMSAFGFSLVQMPVYRASIQVLIEPARPDLGLTQSAKILLRSYVAAMWTTNRAQEVIDRLGLYMTPETLKGDVIIASDDSRMLIQIDVDDNDGEQAKRIAYEWALLLVEWRDSQNQRQDKSDRVYAEILETPTYRLLRPRKLINTAAGAIFGLILGAVVVFVLEWLEAGIVREPRELEQTLGLTVIGVVPPVTLSKKLVGGADAHQ
ncbi:MAG TPA: hypothetical protein ENN14_01780 [Chloroflexi bacterium]|nr:hypothetical protein [Chloroflexota bacterium]